MGAAYRVRQFLAAVRPRMSEGDWARARELLTPSQMELFRRLPAADQQHSFEVLSRLESRGYRQPDLLRAALLHDVGKTAALIRLHHRVAVVLLQNLWPAWLKRVRQEAPAGGWRHPFYVHLEHARIGARLAARAGASNTTVGLIARHHDGGERADDLARALAGADGAS